MSEREHSPQGDPISLSREVLRPSDFGGKEKELVPSAPSLMGDALHILHQKENIGYEVCFEVTQHGPFLSTPSFFIEVGSTEKEWEDANACKTIADVLQELRFPSKKKIAIGIGGGHYAPRFTDITLKELAKNIVIEHDLELTGIVPIVFDVKAKEGSDSKYAEEMSLWTDATPFHEENIPVFSFISGPFYNWHPLDTLDKVAIHQ